MPSARVWTISEIIDYNLQHMNAKKAQEGALDLLTQDSYEDLPVNVAFAFEMAEEHFGGVLITDLQAQHLFNVVRSLSTRDANVFFRIMAAALWFGVSNKVKTPRFNYTKTRLNRMFREARQRHHEHITATRRAQLARPEIMGAPV